MANYAAYVQGDDQIDYTPSGAVIPGDVVVLGAGVGVANRPIAAGALGALHVRGVFDVVKKSGDVLAYGDKVYWDPTNHWAAAAGGSGIVSFGTCARAAASGDATVRVLMVRLA